MKNILIFILALLFCIPSAMSQGPEPVIWLKNNSGIVEDANGSVTLWENDINIDHGDATSATSAEGGEQLQETYPGKVNVGFSTDGAHMDIEGSNQYISDDEFSAFYVGKVGNVGNVATLFGNFRVDGAWSNCSGWRFTRKDNGDMTIQYGRPAYQQVVLSNLPENEFFFFGFSLDANGDYMYFDNSSPIIQTGTLLGADDGSTINDIGNTDDAIINLSRQLPGDFTYDHTEVAELLIYDDAMGTTDFEERLTWLSSEYPEIVSNEFALEEILPADRTDISITADIVLSFDQDIDASSSFPKVYVNKSETEAAGAWTLSPTDELTFSSTEDWPYGALITVELDEGLMSANEASLNIAARSEYNFIVETDTDYGADTVILSPMTTVDFPIVGHELPMFLVVPLDRSEKVPVHIWVHGGGWSGGSDASSVASYSPHGTYLAENLGVATLGISYRTSGSSGNFTLAMEDIDAAYQWAVANADTYNFDMTKIFFSGGSAGSPLAALAAQRYPDAIGLIGFNGMYNFVEDDGSFGQGNGYGQETPSAEANSAFYNLRDNPPASIFMHGDADTTIPLSQSTLFEDEINDNGGRAETVIYPGEPHAFFNLNQPEYEDVLYEMANFVERELAIAAGEIVYNVSFTITDGVVPIENAEVVLSGYGTLLSNQDGVVTFSDIVPETDITYSVSVEGYEQGTGIVSVLDADISENITLSLIAFDVSFTVTDGNLAIENATVLLNGYGELITDISGIVTFSNVIPGDNIGYTVTADGYDQGSGNVSVVSVDLDENVVLNVTTNSYDVTFTVTDGATPIEGATVSLTGYGSLISNNSGVVTFTGVASSDEIDYSVFYNEVLEAEGTISVVDQNINESVIIASDVLGTNIEDINELICYPIPADDILTINNFSGSFVAIYNLSGNLVLSVPISTDQMQLNVSTLQNGYYLLRSENSVKKILVKHN